jgi:hypothetical protein
MLVAVLSGTRAILRWGVCYAVLRAATGGPVLFPEVSCQQCLAGRFFVALCRLCSDAWPVSNSDLMPAGMLVSSTVVSKVHHNCLWPLPGLIW